MYVVKKQDTLKIICVVKTIKQPSSIKLNSDPGGVKKHQLTKPIHRIHQDFIYIRAMLHTSAFDIIVQYIKTMYHNVSVPQNQLWEDK